MATVTIQLQRGHPTQPWGFRLQGGQDFRETLSIKKVTPNTPAHGRVEPGDAIMAISGYDAQRLTHSQATQLIKQAGDMLQLTVSKGLVRSLKPAGPVKFRPSAVNAGQYTTYGQPGQFGGY